MARTAKSAPSRSALPDDWRAAATRGEKGERLREALFRAAAEVVGEVGYANASVSAITSRAGVAQGTFYNYFETRQDLLDQLLPAIGERMRRHVRECARAGSTFAERESLSFRGFFTFLAQEPHFLRILNEAESFAPKAHKAHLEAVADGYASFLGKALVNGELRGFEPREVQVVAFVLMAARNYLAWRYVHGEGRYSDIPEWVARAYEKFVSHGLSGPVAKPVSTPKKVSRRRDVRARGPEITDERGDTQWTSD
jgi:AcrR family transcriptional regulator